MDVKIGLYLSKDAGLGEMIDFDALKETVEEENSFEVWREFDYFNVSEIEAQIREDIEESGLNRIIVGGPSNRFFEDRFYFGETVLVERVPLRELVAWALDPEGEHEDEDESEIQSAAADYLMMAIAKVSNSERPVAHIEETLSKDVLIIGGGVSGMSAAIATADAGYKVRLVEKEAELGGWARRFKSVIPARAPHTQLEEPPHTAMIVEIEANDKITVHTSTTVEKISGQPGQFDVTLLNGSKENFMVGAIIQASGWRPYNPDKLEEKYGYGKLTNVVTNIHMEDMAKEGNIVRPSDNAKPSSVAIVHCAGSRDKEHLSYCSAVCCRAAMKQALYIRDQLPDTDIYLLYKDIRSPGLYEQFYATVQQEERIFLMKGEVATVEGCDKDGVRISLDDTLVGESLVVEADMLVLATGMVPSSKVDVEETTDDEENGGGARSAEKGAGIINLTYRLGTDLPTLKYGFPDSHFICFPYETRRTGIYAAGTVRAPMDIPSARTDGLGAAMKAVQMVESVQKGSTVHPRVGDIAFPDLFLQRCTQCKRCTEECPFSMYEEDIKGTPQLNINRCRRCGICMGACPERIITFKDYNINMGSKIIQSIFMPDEFDEKPRVLCFMCENDARPALDIAVANGYKIDPMVRIIPVRCLGSVNMIWVADALSNGFDGIQLLGCKHGDDYQCHFVKGSELAEKRLGNIAEKLKQLVLEEERVQIDYIEMSDWKKVTTIINSFAEEIRELDLNPYKGF